MHTTVTLQKQIRKLHKSGLTNRKIAGRIGLSHHVVGYWLKKFSLKTNGPTRVRLIFKKGKAICSKCGRRKKTTDFRKQRSNAKYPYWLSYCNLCRYNQLCEVLNTNRVSFLIDRYRRLALRAKKLNIAFELTREEFIEQYQIQRGLCFYTDQRLICRVQQGLHRHSLSVDRLRPSKGYVKGNFVFCINRVNICKHDLTLSEIKEYMPEWHQRIQRFLRSR
jgi:hypothetical protein